ncbi:hypothetical protein [Photobacterium damselae]|uniref:hypothetical protein n=1 Tax=Photobacterium damselae TaxID=38293 RepID=UPI001274CCF4|nr:hypothetical protein [Photobacterium damselae]TLS80654.1 hypothetical protein FD721_00510 [Photobacterium damselae subsp. damselae]
MIRLQFLQSYPQTDLEPSLDELLRLTNPPSRQGVASKLAAPLNAFLHITSTKFKFISINDAKYSEHVLTGFIGFIYVELDISLSNKYSISGLVKRLPCCNLSFKLSESKLTDDAQFVVDYYQKNFNVDEKIKRFYQGWWIADKNGKTVFLDLKSIYLIYDEMFILQIHESVSRYAIKETCSTLVHNMGVLNLLIQKLPVVASDSHAFHYVMSSQNINKTISCIYSLCLNDAVQSELCLKSFHLRWQRAITVFKEVFVNTGIVGKPFYELLAPDFKTSGQQVTSRTKVQKDKIGNAFNKKLITPIPLSYSDLAAKERIFESIVGDIDHVKFYCRNIWDETMKNLDNFKALAEKGQVRSSRNMNGHTNPVNMARVENSCASFRHYGFRYKQKNYSGWLAGNGNTIDFVTLFALPTVTVMQAFLYLLIEMHPSITPSWLERWDLYDDKGNFYGYKEVNGVSTAVSKKERKGKKLAQQEVFMNADSKKLIDEYLELTQQLRTQLQQENDHRFRKMLIAVDGINSKAKLYTSQSANTKELTEKLAQPTNYKAEILAVSISNHLTHARMRSAVGVRVYFETQSVHAMAEALGHEKYQPYLINRYLPKSLWDYFTNRWIRQFQNAIVYEAMKDSPYLFEAIDLQQDELATFLENHGLGELPLHIKTGKKKAEDIANDDLCEFDDGVFLLSTSLLQLFMALVAIVDTISDETKLTQFAKDWYEAAKFVLSHISVSLENRKGTSVGNAEIISDDIKEMYYFATNNPLNPEIIMGAIVCQSA